MKVGLVGGSRDGQSAEVPQPLPPTIRVPVPVVQRYYMTNDEDVSFAALDTDVFLLAYTVLDRRPYYVEQGLLERWRDLDSVVR